MNNEQLFDKAKQYIPGGVNSPVRSFKSVGGIPRFIKKAQGAYIYDEEGNKYIDFVGSWGPMILGHAHPNVVEAITQATQNSTSFGAPTLLEIELAELICTQIPSVEKLRLVNSGTEATMTAIRLARSFTKRQKILKFEGCYHGHADAFLISAGSGVLDQNQADSAGLSEHTLNDTLLATYNNLASVTQKIEQNIDQIAALIVEPVAANMGCIAPEPEFLEGLRTLCTQHGIVLIFDEVITGFRLAFGGAQTYFSITADIVTYGKIIGGGLPVGAIGGKNEIMNQLAPIGNVYQAGTLSGNPLAVSAGLAVLKKLLEPHFYDMLNEKTRIFAEDIRALFKRKGITAVVNSIGSLLTVFFTNNSVSSFAHVQQISKEQYAEFFHKMLQNGIYLPPSPHECWFIGEKHTQTEFDYVLKIMDEVWP